MQCSSKLRLMHWHLYAPLPPLLVLPTLALFFSISNFGWMFDPWKKSPSNTLHTALSKKKPIPPLSFWRERHCSASERLEKEEPGCRRQPWWLADRFAAQNCSRVHGQTLLYFKFSNVKMTTRVRVEFVEGVFFFFPFFSPKSLWSHHSVPEWERAHSADCSPAEGEQSSGKNLWDITTPAWPPPSLPPPSQPPLPPFSQCQK